MQDAMIRCPDCGSTDVKVIKAGDGWRRRACPSCERRWTTDEIERAGSVWRKGDPIPKGGRPERQSPLRLVPNLSKVGSPVAPISGGLGQNGIPVGGIRDHGFSSSLTLPVVVDPDPERARSDKRAKRPATKLIRGSDGVVRMPFTPEFETFWTAIGRGPGRKEPAFRAYVKRGNPDPTKAAITWKAYVASLPEDQVERGAIAHVATWLNQGGHLEEYGAPASKKTAQMGLTPSEYPEFE